MYVDWVSGHDACVADHSRLMLFCCLVLLTPGEQVSRDSSVAPFNHAASYASEDVGEGDEEYCDREGINAFYASMNNEDSDNNAQGTQVGLVT
jgi:hypothetical protein